MKKTGHILLVIATLCAGIAASRAFAWDMRLQASFNFNYEYYTQLGSNGFFGPYDVSDSAFGAPYDANTNAWLGIDPSYSLFYGQHPGAVSGSDASVQTSHMLIDGELILNKALKARARYRIGGSNVGANYLSDYGWPTIGPGFNTKYFNSTTPGQNNPQAYGEWTMLWVQAVTPWATISFGKKPFAVGCGLQYNAEDCTEESLLFTAPYGPLQLGFGFYPMTFGNSDLFDLLRRWTPARVALWEGRYEYYHPSFLWDKSGRPNKLMALVNYAAGPLKIGLGAIYTSVHYGAEGFYYSLLPFQLPTMDQTDWEGWLYAKYSNGRFFLNTEVDFFNRIRTSQRTVSGLILGAPPIPDGGGSVFAPKYVESWKWMVEAGVLTGPAKFSLLYAFLPGPDRRHGVLIDRQPTTYPTAEPYTGGNSTVSYLNRHVGNSGVFRPYSLLFAYDYGAGLNCTDLNGNGCVTDASVLAARLDYSLAANLNVHCSFLWAQRASHGWQLGCIWPYDRELVFTPQQNAFVPEAEFGAPVPTIPDRDLGWEVDIGGQWRLLENLTLHFTAAYWQPGGWFKYACVDKSVTDWDDLFIDNNWGVNPDRNIDPILGLRIEALAEF